MLCGIAWGAWTDVQLSVHTETLVSASLDNLVKTRYPMHALVTSYLKASLTTFLQATMTPCIAEVVTNQSLLDLCTDPREIYLRLLDEEEKATGLPSARPRDRDADQVLQTEGDARALYIRHLQALRALTDVLLKSLYVAVGAMPYTLRYLVREAYLSLRVSAACHLVSFMWGIQELTRKSSSTRWLQTKSSRRSLQSASSYLSSYQVSLLPKHGASSTRPTRSDRPNGAILQRSPIWLGLSPRPLRPRVIWLRLTRRGLCGCRCKSILLGRVCISGIG